MRPAGETVTGNRFSLLLLSLVSPAGALRVSPCELQEAFYDIECRHSLAQSSLFSSARRRNHTDRAAAVSDGDVEDGHSTPASQQSEPGRRAPRRRNRLVYAVLGTGKKLRLKLDLIHELDRSCGQFFTSTNMGRSAESFQIWRVTAASEEGHRWPQGVEVWCISALPPGWSARAREGSNAAAAGQTKAPAIYLDLILPRGAGPCVTSGSIKTGKDDGGCWLLGGFRAFLWKTVSKTFASCSAVVGEHADRADSSPFDPAECLLLSLCQAGSAPHELLHVRVGEAHFCKALTQTRASLTAHDLRHYSRMRNLYASQRRPR